MKRLPLYIVLSTAALTIFLLSGCAGPGVNVWDRDILAKPEMQMDGQNLDQSLDDHIYFSKEASDGGRAFGGGGCGCN